MRLTLPVGGAALALALVAGLVLLTVDALSARPGEPEPMPGLVDAEPDDRSPLSKASADTLLLVDGPALAPGERAHLPSGLVVTARDAPVRVAVVAAAESGALFACDDARGIPRCGARLPVTGGLLLPPGDSLHLSLLLEGGPVGIAGGRVQVLAWPVEG